MTEPKTFEPSWVSPPGDTVADLLEEHGWTAAQFAERMEYTPKHINELLHGRASITADTALRLEKVLGSTAQFWLNRESQYREAKARQDSSAVLKDSLGWLKELPMKQMLEWKWVPNANDDEGQVAECLRFFGVSSFSAWLETYSKPVEHFAAFRAVTKHAMKVGAVAAWLRKGELDSARIVTKPWDRAAFKALIPSLRSLTLESDPQKFLPELTSRCAEVGVAFVLQRVPEGCPVHGATKFLTPDKALLMLSFRHLRDDFFWFSFFHEAGHLLLHPKRTMFLEVPNPVGSEEQEANSFSEEVLIPSPKRETLDQIRTQGQIRSFAAEVGISPGIVLGQLQHRRLLPYNRFPGLINRYRWRED